MEACTSPPVCDVWHGRGPRNPVMSREQPPVCYTLCSGAAASLSLPQFTRVNCVSPVEPLPCLLPVVLRTCGVPALGPLRLGDRQALGHRTGRRRVGAAEEGVATAHC